MGDVSKRYNLKELIEYFDEKLAETIHFDAEGRAVANQDILVDMCFKHSEINMILSALHHYLDSDDCK